MENNHVIENSVQGSNVSCFRKWMNLQEEDLSELHQALDLNSDGRDHTVELKQLEEKNMIHFQEYATQRCSLAQYDVSSYFSPSWCSSLEGSMLWAGGCRPSIFIRLVYALSGNEFELNLEKYLQGKRINGGGLGDISAIQIGLINSLQIKTVKLEDKLSSRLATLQEDMADQPIVIMTQPQESGKNRVPNREMNDALNKHSGLMVTVLEEADNLRLSTMKEVISILTPFQGVAFLAAGKKLHLCLHEWGMIRDHENGRG